jgi:hypothetical protein
MTEATPQERLGRLRHSIDNLEAALVHLLAELRGVRENSARSVSRLGMLFVLWCVMVRETPKGSSNLRRDQLVRAGDRRHRARAGVLRPAVRVAHQRVR